MRRRTTSSMQQYNTGGVGNNNQLHCYNTDLSSESDMTTAYRLSWLWFRGDISVFQRVQHLVGMQDTCTSQTVLPTAYTK